MEDDDARARLLRRRHALSDRLRSLRALRGLTQDGLIERSGVSRSTVQRAEAGTVAIRIDALWAIADALGVPVTSLLTDERSTTPDVEPGGGAQGGAGLLNTPPERQD